MNYDTRLLALASVTILLAGPLGSMLPTADAAAHEGIDPLLEQTARENPTQQGLVLVGLDEAASPASFRQQAPEDVRVVRSYPDFGIVAVHGTLAELEDLARLDSVASVALNHPVELATRSGAIATRARTVWSNLSTHEPVRLDGQILTGEGVGIAVIDTGVDATHPDLRGNVALNQEFVCSTPGIVNPATLRCGGWWAVDELVGVPLDLDGCTDELWAQAANTDVGGHGTHVAGTIAGDGTASDGRWAGVAPGASIYGLGIGDGSTLFAIMEALQWVNCNHDAVSPPVKVVSMSLAPPVGAGIDPLNDAITHLVEEEGLTAVIAAGNGGCCGTTNPFTHTPIPGVLGVANYDDEETGTRTGNIFASSSRCQADSPAHACPDIAAPGTAITATRSTTSTRSPNLLFSPYYETRTGTSMSTPHVAGIIALLLQANPSLSPAEIEDVLEDTARPITGEATVEDPSNEGNVSIAAGHGLVDTVAALQDPRVAGGSIGSIEPLPQVTGQPHVYLGGIMDPQPAAGTPPTAEVAWTVPTGTGSELAERFVLTGNESNWPVTQEQACRFVAFQQGKQVAEIACEDGLREDTNGAQMRGVYDFPQRGDYTIEAQLEFPGHGYESFDSFDVRAR